MSIKLKGGPDPILAAVEDLETLKGQYLRNSRDKLIYQIIDVGDAGVTVLRAEGYGGQTSGNEILLTWRLVKAIYVIMVHAGEIDSKGLH